MFECLPVNLEKKDMAKTDFKTVDEYQRNFPADIKERLETVRDIIRQTAPDAEEIISYQIPAYKYHGYLIYYSGYKAHISIASPWSADLLAAFKTDLAKYTVSKSAIQFPNDQPLPVALIKKIVKFRMKENIEKEKEAAGKKKK
jgi:uncharacterized protein YdhG (YjbR/CyaY superfamily)